jgi:hypothetical protein
MRILIIVALLGCHGVYARELRTPLNLNQGITGSFHIPTQQDCNKDKNRLWDINVWGAGYAQSAGAAYGSECEECKVPISTLFFGKTPFMIAGAFFNSVTPAEAGSSSTVASFATITPQIAYSEQGVMFGLNAQYRFKDRWQAGVRTRIPFRAVQVFNDASNEEAGSGELDLSAVRRLQSDLFVGGTDPNASQDGVVEPDWAYRLDFLAALHFASNTKNMVNFGTGPAFNTQMNDNMDVTEQGNLDYPVPPDLNPGNIVHMIQVPVGSAPNGLLGAAWNTEVAASPFLDAAGTGPGAGQRTRFQSGVDYTPLANSAVAQSKFWVVPTLIPNSTNPPGNGNLQITGDASTIQTHIETLIEILASGGSAADVLELNGISLASQSHRGIGDMDTDFFIGYWWGNALKDARPVYTEFQFGLRWPTAHRIRQPGFVLNEIARGNDGHYEAKLELLGWWQPVSWFAWRNDISYHKVFKRTERVNAAFAGATVQNIGPAVDAGVQWQYGIFHSDLNFMQPLPEMGLANDVAQQFGFVLGYELYWKGQDNIEFLAGDCMGCDECDGPLTPSTSDGCTALDFFGVRRQLDPAVLEKNTNRLANKIRTELFFSGKCGDIFLGWTQVVGGRNIMQETAWQLGINMQF